MAVPILSSNQLQRRYLLCRRRTEHSSNGGDAAKRNGEYEFRNGADGDGEQCKQQSGQWSDGDVYGAGERSQRDLYRWVVDPTATTNSSGVATAPTFTANGTAGTYTVTASVSGLATPTNFSLTNLDTTPPTISLTAPAAGSTISATIPVTATAADNVGVVGVQFKLDGANLGAENTSAPYSASWNTTTGSNGAHSLTSVAEPFGFLNKIVAETSHDNS